MRSAPRTARSAGLRSAGLGAVLVLCLAATLAVAGPAPARASTGGSAQATGLRAQAPEVTLEVTTSGAVSMIQPVLDRLTSSPILTGRQILAAEAGTPQSPAGQESDHSPQRAIPHLLTIEEVSAHTERVQDAELTAQANTGAMQIAVLGLQVLDVGPVQAAVTTHPSEDPTATAEVPTLSACGRQMDLPEGEPVQIDEAISTADALAALEEAFPGLQAITRAAGGTFSASGALEVMLGTTEDADPDTGAAQAIGLSTQVGLDLDVDICIPRIGSTGCGAEVAIATKAQVLDLVLAETSVQRPETLPLIERIPWAVLIPFAVIAGVGLLVFGLLMGKRLTERGSDQGSSGPPGPGPPGPGERR